MAVSLVALFVSLGGISYAAATIGSAQIKNNSVQSKDIRNDNIRGKDIRTGTLGSSDVKDKSLKGVDIKDQSLTGADILSSSLSKVPAANNADHAGTAGHANTANTAGNAGTVGGVPASALQGKVRWVQVKSDGDIQAQTGGITAKRDLEGQYSVDFGSSTVGGMINASGAELGTGSALVNAQRCGGPALGTDCLVGNTPNRVIVHTDDPDIAGLNDAAFYVALLP